MTNQNKHPYAHAGKDGVGVFGKRLKAERIRQGWQLQAFAMHTGISESQLTGAENRGVMPTLFNAMTLASALNVRLGYLCGLED